MSSFENSSSHHQQKYENKDNQVLLIQCYQIIKTQQSQIQRLETIIDKNSKQLKQFKRTHNHTFNQQLQNKLSELMKKYQQMAHEHQKINIVCDQKNQIIKEMQSKELQLKKQLKDTFNTLQSIRNAYQAKIKKIMIDVRQKTIRQIVQKDRQVRQYRQKAHSRVHLYANSTPKKYRLENDEREQNLINYTCNNRLIHTKNNLMNTPYMVSNTKRLQKKLFSNKKFEAEYSDQQMTSNPQQPIKCTKKHQFDKFLMELTSQISKFDRQIDI